MLPLKIEFDYWTTSTKAIRAQQVAVPAQYAALLITKADEQMILPLILGLGGSAGKSQHIDRHAFNTWSYTKSESQPETFSAELSKVLEKFAKSPVLLCRDVWSLRSSRYKNDWVPRVFSDVWFFHERLEASSTSYRGRGRARFASWEHYSRVSVLTSRILETAFRVKWNTDPCTTPFSCVPLAAFDFQQPALPLDKGSRLAMEYLVDNDEEESDSDDIRDDMEDTILDELEEASQSDDDDVAGSRTTTNTGGRQTRTFPRSMLVDGLPSCHMFHDCHLKPQTGSRYCEYHSTTLMKLVMSSIERNGKITATMLEDMTQSLLKPSRLQNSPQDKDDLEWLRRLYHTTPGTTWLIDAEFTVLTEGKCALAGEFSIRDLRGNDLFSFTVDYGGASLQELEDIVGPYLTYNLGPGREHRLRMFRGFFHRRYSGLVTKGHSLPQIRNRIKSLGYSSETHTLLSWSSVADLQIFFRFLDDDDSILVDSTSPKHAMNVAALCSHMVPEAVSSRKLDILHPLLCPDTTIIKYHDAAADTLAMYEVIKAMVEAEG